VADVIAASPSGCDRGPTAASPRTRRDNGIKSAQRLLADKSKVLTGQDKPGRDEIIELYLTLLADRQYLRFDGKRETLVFHTRTQP